MRKISYKLGLMLISLFIILMVMIGDVFDSIYVKYYVEHIGKDLYCRGQSYAKILAEYFDQQTLRHVAMMEGEAETAVVVINSNGEVLSASNAVKSDQKKYLKPPAASRSSSKIAETDWRNNPYIVTKSLIMRNNHILGTVIMFSPTAPIRHEVNEIHWAVAIFGVSAFLLSSLSFFLNK